MGSLSDQADKADREDDVIDHLDNNGVGSNL